MVSHTLPEDFNGLKCIVPAIVHSRGVGLPGGPLAFMRGRFGLFIDSALLADIRAPSAKTSDDLFRDAIQTA